MTLAADWAWSKPNAQAVKAAGIDVALRYLSPDPSKNLSRPEADALLAARVGIGLLWESTANRALSGAPGGTVDGQEAAAQASAVGFPPGCPLLANLGDFAAYPQQIPAIDAYYQAFNAYTAGWAHGGYATGYIIDQLVARGRQGIWWQNAMNDAGDLGSNVSPNAWIYQRTVHTSEIAGAAGGWWDENVILRPANWWGSTPAPTPPAPPPPRRKEVEMIIVHSPAGQAATFDGAHKVYIGHPSTLAALIAAGIALVEYDQADYDAVPNAK